MFIHKSKPYLPANPDGSIGNESIVDIKCPICITEYTSQEAVNEKKLKCIKNIDGKLVLKKTNHFYYQVQAQLNITKRKNTVILLCGLTKIINKFN